MIYIVADRPKKNEQREGFLQRVRAVDGLLVGEDCVYDNDFTNSGERRSALLEASVIYVHSIYNAEKIIDLYPPLGCKIITDMHGVVPEEQQLLGNSEDAARKNAIESEVIRYGKYFIAVTSAMVEHYIKKYKDAQQKQWIVLPIFNDELQPNIQKSHAYGRVIYSGGAQKWQKCDQMIKSAVIAAKKPKLTILSNDIDAFRELVTAHVGDKGSIDLRRVPNSRIAPYYDRSDMGFVLRDNNVVNQVACPTKIIEYMKRGVVPIVDFEGIGDFKKLGYEYVKRKDFEHGKYTPKQLDAAAVRNLEVLNELESISKNGTRELVTIIANARVSKSIDDSQSISMKYIDNLARIERLELELQRERIMHQEQKELVESLLNSKRWRFGEIVSYPKAVVKNFAATLIRRHKG